MIIEITDGTTPMLSAIRTVSRDVAFEIMSKVGNKIRENAGKNMVATRHRHHWLQRKNKKGNGLTPYYSKTETKELGQRTAKDATIDNPSSMKHMISSNLIEEKGIVIVGGRNRGKKVILRKDGEVVGGSYLNAVGKRAQSIIHKLDTGERNEYHGWNKSLEDKRTMEKFRNAKYRGRNFMTKGFGDSISYMKQELTTGYEKTVGRAVNKVKVNIKPYTRKVS